MDEATRPAVSQASRTRPNAAAESPTEWNGTLYSSPYLAASRGVRRAPAPPPITGGRGPRARPRAAGGAPPPGGGPPQEELPPSPGLPPPVGVAVHPSHPAQRLPRRRRRER